MIEKYTDLLTEQLNKIDYCSGVPDFKHMACKEHDDDYDNQIGKWKADWKFATRSWVNANKYRPETTKFKEKVKAFGKRFIAKTIVVTYYIGVTILGWRSYYKAGKKNNV